MNRETLADTVAKFDDDQQYRELAVRYGLRALACLLDGLDAEQPHVLADFSAANHFAHQLWRGHDPAEAL